MHTLSFGNCKNILIFFVCLFFSKDSLKKSFKNVTQNTFHLAAPNLFRQLGSRLPAGGCCYLNSRLHASQPVVSAGSSFG